LRDPRLDLVYEVVSRDKPEKPGSHVSESQAHFQKLDLKMRYEAYAFTFFWILITRFVNAVN
jgi:hypothetical protein